MRGLSTWYALLIFLPQSSPGDKRLVAGTAVRRSVCEPGAEFWSRRHGSCRPCTRCQPEFTVSPCTLYKDAVCGPLSALELDWSFLSTGKRGDDGESRRTIEAVTSKMLWRFPEFLEDGLTADKQIGVLRERLVWDWQTVALILAVCACILFFLVAGCSALLYARQWRRMKKSFVPVEEISARLNLMVKAELAELVSGTGPEEPRARRQYLEKFLDEGRGSWPEVTGNVYIEERREEHLKPKRLQLARIHRSRRDDF